MTLPPDRGHIATERRHERSMQLDRCGVGECITLMLSDHEQVVPALREATDALASFIGELVPRVRGGGRLVYLGAGTSGRLGVLDASECPPTFQSAPDQIVGVIAGGDSALRKSSEGMEDDPDGASEALESLALTERDTLLGIAAGGTTPYVLGGMRIAHSRGSMTSLLTCAPPREPVAACDHLIVLETGPELLTGSTRLKAGTATKLALNIITTTLFVQLGKVYSNLMVDLRATNAKLTDRAIRILIELFPHLTRTGAASLLNTAEGQLKVAIVMQATGCDAREAVARLSDTSGSVGDVCQASLESHP